MGKEVNRSWVIIGVALSVAIAASLITAGITGSIVKSTTRDTMTKVVDQMQKKGVEVYTKQEMDTALKGTATYSGVLDMLRYCEVKGANIGGGYSNCKEKCSRDYGWVALNTYLYVRYYFNTTVNQKQSFVATWIGSEEYLSKAMAESFVHSVGGSEAILDEYKFGCNCCAPDTVPTPSPKTPGRMGAPEAKFLF